jgi:hypothetical protein
LLSGIVALVATFTVLEIIFMNCVYPSKLSRIGGIPGLFWIYPGLLAIVGGTMMQGSALLDNRIAFAIGAGIVSAVVIALIRWFHRYRADVPLHERLRRLSFQRFLRGFHVVVITIELPQEETREEPTTV